MSDNKTMTEKGAITNQSTLDKVVDWFYHGAALRREKNKDRIIALFDDAFKQDKTKALRILFYIRDIRGGQGERRIFRICLNHLAKIESTWLKDNLALIAEYGRYDDYLCLLDTEIKSAVIDFVKAQLDKDIAAIDSNTPISLLAKWMPSVTTKNKEKRRYLNALLNSGKFGTVKNYRQTLSKLRDKLNIVEKNLCNKAFAEIEYSKVSSNAMSKYSKTRISSGLAGTFWRNDLDRFKMYLDAVKNGKTIDGKEVKINAKTLYPYDVITKYMSGYSISHQEDPAAEAQWNALPDYVPEINGVVIYDTSGSMYGLPMAVSLSLAIYIAERNKSEVWRNYVIPFSSNATWKKVKGNNLVEKIESIYTGDCSNTNLQAAFDLILGKAIYAQVPKEDMPKQLIIISDMEFDSVSSNNQTNYEAIKSKYKKAGYDLPQLIWWNVESRSNQTPITVNDKNCLLLSGCSPAVMQVALGGSYDFMEAIDKIINQERYSCINYN